MSYSSDRTSRHDYFRMDPRVRIGFIFVTDKQKQRAQELARREGFLSKEQASARAEELKKEQDERIAAEIKIIRQRTKNSSE